MIKSTRGSVTIVAFIAMVFFTLYGIILYSNSARTYIVQSNALENIKSSYGVNLDTDTLINIHSQLGGRKY